MKIKQIVIIFFLLIAKIVCAQNTILWEVKDTVHNKTSWLLGTYHQLGNHFVDSLPVIKEKLRTSDLAIFESVDGEATKDYIYDRQADLSFQKELKKGYAENLVSLSKEWLYPLEKLKPAEVLIKMQQEYYKSHCQNVMETDTWDHLDNYLQFLANGYNVPIFGLETDSSQVAMVNQNTGNADWKSLRKEIYFWIDANLDVKSESDLCHFASQYKKFQLDYKFDQGCMDDVLIEERNENWMKALPLKLRENNCFVAVGLFHLFRSCGLIEQLRENGFLCSGVKIQ